MAVTLRQARPADAAEMHRVRVSVRENRLQSVALTEQDYIAAITSPGRGWVCEVGGQIVAFAVGNGASGNIWALFVDPAHEGRGLGRVLHDAMVAWLWEQGLERLWLTTEPRTRAEGFYRAAGWRNGSTTAHGELEFELDRTEKMEQR